MSFLTLILSLLVILGSVTAELKCGYTGIPLCVIGRSYNLFNKKDGKDLRANVIIKDDKCDLNEEYINDMLSEHASIGTFNKFSIELMNLGAPLWFIQLSQNAALDEINHTKIMLNILNANDRKCVEIGKFPNHEIEFSGDCNAISLDVANGGCFGETISSIKTMIKANKISELYSVAIDEVRHSTLAWVSAKWMINNCQNIDIANKKWWQNQLKQSNQLSIIKTIFNQFWHFQGDYHRLYKIVHDMLYKEVSSIHQN